MTLRLRPYVATDAPAQAALFADPEVMRYVGDGQPLEHRAATQLFAKIFELYARDPHFHIWAIEDERGYAGHAELKRRTGRTEYELIYFLTRDRWGAGLGGHVVDALLAKARGFAIPFVIATVDAHNTASLRILERRGFVRDARLSEELAAPAYRRDL